MFSTFAARFEVRKYRSNSHNSDFASHFCNADKMREARTVDCHCGTGVTISTQDMFTTHHITSHHITSHHITSHHITSHHITSHHITSHHITCVNCIKSDMVGAARAVKGVWCCSSATGSMDTPTCTQPCASHVACTVTWQACRTMSTGSAV